MSTASPSTAPGRTFLGHPVGLYVLFFTEMWERFSYYGMRALLVPYMVNYFRWVQKDASTTYKIYTSLVYVTPILGGYLADRILGNRRAVIIGGLLMAIGHFLMAFEAYAIFYAALVFLIMGNGFFKPNMSTQVGRLYPANDGRRDGAYTIFYMGINLGAFLSPLVCGWLQENTEGGYHSGFTMAGIGMVLGLLIYLLGQPLVKEIDPDAGPRTTPPSEPSPAPGKPVPGPDTDITDAPGRHLAGDGVTTTPPAPGTPGEPPALTEAEAARTPSSLGALAAVVPMLLLVLGALLVLGGAVLGALAIVDWFDGVMLGIVGVCSLLLGYVANQVQGGMRDRVLAILLLGIFVVFFWAAFEQAGNVLNLWADKHTDRYLTTPAPGAELKPPLIIDKGTKAEAGPPVKIGLFERFRNMFRLKPKTEEESLSAWLKASLNPVSTASFQSINALAIFVLAPLFAYLWVVLDRKGWQPSIPMKMTIGLVFMSASMAIMIAAAQTENLRSSTGLVGGKLPAAVTIEDGDKVFVAQKKGPPKVAHAGRLTYDATNKQLHIMGVLPDNEAFELIDATAPADFRAKVDELKKLSKTIDDETVKKVEVHLDKLPPGFDMQYSGLKPSVVEFKDNTLTAYTTLADKEEKGLLVAAGDPEFRETIRQLYIVSNKNVVGSAWLLWTYILATLGELCLSPVGLSMVSKLAPAKFATMLMGVWMLTSAFGNFTAGALGEIWGTIPPIQFFLLSTVVVGVAALVLFALVRLVVRLMHGVK